MLHCQSHENDGLKNGIEPTVDNLILTWSVVTLLELSFPTKVLVPADLCSPEAPATGEFGLAWSDPARQL